MKHTRSETLFVEAQKVLPGGVNSPVRAFRSVGGEPFFAKSVSGCEIETVDGRRLIDFVCSCFFYSGRWDSLAKR